MSNQTFMEQDNTIDITQIPVADNATMWYCALLPLFALFFQTYADSIYLGYFLWGLVIVTRIAVCFADMKKLRRMGLWQNGSAVLVLFPVLYMFKRCKLLKRSNFVCGIAVACLIFAVAKNGFTRSLEYNEDTYYTLVSDYYASYITNLPDDYNADYVCNTSITINDLLNRYCLATDDKATDSSAVEYEYESISGEHYITAVGTKAGQEVRFEFLLKYDGFSYNGCEITSVTIGGHKIEGEELKLLLRDVFMISKDEL